ncbi:MAG: DUF4019 domain-containing protein [Gammaproteobacteria bacterium]
MKYLLCTLLLLLSTPIAAQVSESQVIEEARSATVEWLMLTDTAQYRSSWESASTLFKASISKGDWEESVSAARMPLGDLESRDPAAAEIRKTLPGAPDGEYVVFEFASSFENKAAAVETVTAMKDDDGVWRVTGYFIR